MAKPDKQIEAEAKAAIDQVINRTKDSVIMKHFKPAIRKAFPFGPHATPLERTIWEQTVESAIADLSRKLAAVLLVVLLCGVPALAQGADPVPSYKVTPEMLKRYDLIPATKEDGTTVYLLKPKSRVKRALAATGRFIVKYPELCYDATRHQMVLHPKIVRGIKWTKDLFITYCQVKAGI